MPFDPAILADNAAQLLRLQSLVPRLHADADLGDGWTIGVALAHLAFWDRRAVRLLDHWRRNGVAPNDHPNVDVLNDALVDEWRRPIPLHIATSCARALTRCDQVYNCQWSHSGGASSTPTCCRSELKSSGFVTERVHGFGPNPKDGPLTTWKGIIAAAG